MQQKSLGFLWFYSIVFPTSNPSYLSICLNHSSKDWERTMKKKQIYELNFKAEVVGAGPGFHHPVDPFHVLPILHLWAQSGSKQHMHLTPTGYHSWWSVSIAQPCDELATCPAVHQPCVGRAGTKKIGFEWSYEHTVNKVLEGLNVDTISVPLIYLKQTLWDKKKHALNFRSFFQSPKGQMSPNRNSSDVLYLYVFGSLSSDSGRGVNLCCGGRTSQQKTLQNQNIPLGLEGFCFGRSVISHVGHPDLNRVHHNRPESCSAPSCSFHLDSLSFENEEDDVHAAAGGDCPTCCSLLQSSSSSRRFSGTKAPAASWAFWAIKLHSRHLSSFSLTRIKARRSDISSWT